MFDIQNTLLRCKVKQSRSGAFVKMHMFFSLTRAIQVQHGLLASLLCKQICESLLYKRHTTGVQVEQAQEIRETECLMGHTISPTDVATIPRDLERSHASRIMLVKKT